MALLTSNRFSRDLVMDTRRQYRDKTLRKQKVNQLYQKFGAEEVWFDGKIIGWRVGQQFHCYKKAFATRADAELILDMSIIRTRGRLKANDVYQCPKCGLWHSTSQGHLAGSHK